MTPLQILGGSSIILGVFVALVGFPLIITVLVTMFPVHIPNGSSSIGTAAPTEDGPQFGAPGHEVNLLYIEGAALILIGPIC